MSSVVTDTEDEADVVGRALMGIVDIGSNGIRFSISSKAPHHARTIPCVFKDRVGISLFDVQYEANSTQKIPIPKETIQEVCAAMKRFKLICEDFGVPESGVRLVATEATREAVNSQEFRDAIYDSTGWEVELLSKEDEGRIGAYGVASSFNSLSGLFMDLGGGSTQISWIQCLNGEIKTSPTSVSLPYGAAALTKRMQFEDKKALYFEIQNAYKEALKTIDVPQSMIDDAERNGGFDLYTCGGGLRGLGYSILADIKEYPIPTIINGFSCSFTDFINVSNFLFLKGALPKKEIFRVSERRRTQLPAVGLLVSAAFDSLPKIKTVHFSEGGVREGCLYSMLPREIRAQDPLIIASRPYAPLLADKYLELLRTALPEKYVPREVRDRIAPALCNLAFVHCSYPKELQPTAALHVATTGIIAGSHGLSHLTRALIGIALCDRWGGDLPESEEKHKTALCDSVKRDGNKIEMERIVWWTKYCGTIMYVICGVHPGGNIRDGVFNFKIVNGDMEVKDEDEKRKFDVIVQISNDDIKTSASVRGRILTLQKKIRKLSRGSSEKVKIGVELYER
ncbi:CYFA0S27e01002g1_1 [Cyberlindnera fabianii]|uniref:CYFA0S27e01002g1_1 n=1 Tax=Cyberlindnera fabianii TaxID=36022 RepID=A0A061BAS0_CYBFA|nr:CYFA0S27e01002g1_1 [Cyberlindnera fabianii]